MVLPPVLFNVVGDDVPEVPDTAEDAKEAPVATKDLDSTDANLRCTAVEDANNGIAEDILTLSEDTVDKTAERNMFFIADILDLEEIECLGRDKLADGNKLIVVFSSCEINFPVDITASCFDIEDK